MKIIHELSRDEEQTSVYNIKKIRGTEKLKLNKVKNLQKATFTISLRNLDINN
jgi:hypothetical protein